MDAAVLFDLGAAAVTSTFAAFIGGVLGLPPTHVTVNDAVVTPGATVSTDTSAYVPLQACRRLTMADCVVPTGRFSCAPSALACCHPTALCSSEFVITICAFVTWTRHELLMWLNPALRAAG